ncbi:MAG: hypothetical protein ABJH52_01630 [Henriciella sp.]
MGDKNKFPAELSHLFGSQDSEQAFITDYLTVLIDTLTVLNSSVHNDQNQAIIQSIENAIRVLLPDEE